ncbi:hypothetical protein [Mycolicibacterium sp.]|uniref:hypothetical protein n=1 Tax=Mycolicibacterium sp. TaxID=2320850 RepID=UPI0025EA70CC|nr:hypothetical protein [Mycolicibacterium sp.]
MDNTLDYIDQASFLGLRALGHGPVIQFSWIYGHDVDLDALRRFHHNLGRGLLGRRIQRSPLPFGRHRWIAWPGPADIAVEAAALPRSEVLAWFDGQAALPIDPEYGPSFRLAVQPIAGGGAAVTLVLSHTVADGVGATLAVVAAAKGESRDLGYPTSGSSAKLPALLADSRRAVREFPGMVRAAIALARLARTRSDSLSSPARETNGKAPAPDQRVTLAAITVYADAETWDARAAELGGTPTALFIGLTGRLGGRLGWTNGEGRVDVTVPVNERTEGDTRGNALTQVSMTVDPDQVCADLTSVRAGLKAALSGLSEARHELLAPLPLVPVVPKALARRLEGMVISTGVIGSSNLGQFDPAVNRPDGTDADFFSVRMAENLTGADIRRTGGSFFPVVTGRVNGRIFISIGYTNAEASTTRAELAQSVRETLADFCLSGTVE